MGNQKRLLASAFPLIRFVRFLAPRLGLCLLWLVVSVRLTAQNSTPYIPATAAFDNSPVCSSSDLHNDHDAGRLNPEWKPVNGLTIDPSNPALAVQDQPTILEGFVASPPLPPECLNVLGQFASCEDSNTQMPSEVSEEDIPWNHYTHDFTFKVVPDPSYQHLMSSWLRSPAAPVTVISPTMTAGQCSDLGGHLVNPFTCVVPEEKCPDLDHATDVTCHHLDMEVEWDNASLMKVNDDDDRTWGAVPEYVWPAVGDRVWVEGRWVFDCGHPSVPKVLPEDRKYVKYSTEIHPPRALVTFRLNHPALSSLGSIFSESWLPVTGAPTLNAAGKPSSDPTHVPVTQADIFISGNGGGANDLCMIEATTSSNDCQHGHTNPVIQVGDRNYVFDIYPPGTDYHAPMRNGTFHVDPPVPGASLQWRTMDQKGELPAHACPINNNCLTPPAIFCLIDASTPPPDQSETGCPSLPAQPTRLRVIVAFNHNTDWNYFAQSVLLGWDDVPAPPNTPAVRTFRVTLHGFTVLHNGESFLHDGDWRVFVNVGGQYRYIDPLFDRNPDGSNECNGDALTDNGDGDCFLFDDTPWIVSVRDGEPIHVAVGGFESDGVDADFLGAPDNRGKWPGGDNPFGVIDLADLLTANDDRIGPYEFDLKAPAYRWILPNGSTAPSFSTQKTSDGENYKVEFVVREIVNPPVGSSFPLRIGEPHFDNFVTSATPVVLTAASRGFLGFQYRFHHQGHPLPTFGSPLPFPVHWTSIALPATSQSVSVHLSGGSGDGPYDLQYSNENSSHQLEPRHTTPLILDNTPPVVGIVQPKPTTYTHSAVLTLNYSVNDGTGSGVGVVTPLMDNMSSLAGHGLQSGQAINLLTSLKLGSHTFKITAADKVNNTRTSPVSFTIIATPLSIQDDVQQFLLSHAIKNSATAKNLTTQLRNAAAARAAGHCSTAATIYRAFIKNLNALSGKGVTATAAAIMIADAQYLIAHCP
jgi:hypothetical protein